MALSCFSILNIYLQHKPFFKIVTMLPKNNLNFDNLAADFGRLPMLLFC